MVLTPKEKREIRKQAEERAKEEKKAREKADRKYNRPTGGIRSQQNGAARAARVTNIYQPNYGDTVNVTGHGNQVALRSQGDVTQEIGEQDISTQPVDLDLTLAAVRDLLHHLQDGGIQVENEELAEALRSEAVALRAEADVEEPDQGRMKRLAAGIGTKLAAIPVTGLGGFTAQLLSAAFLPGAESTE